MTLWALLLICTAMAALAAISIAGAWSSFERAKPGLLREQQRRPSRYVPHQRSG
jgi:hypothetical protein